MVNSASTFFAEFSMFNSIKAAILLPLFLLGAQAHAGITSVGIGGSGSHPGENWAKGDTWHIRAILLDSTLQPIGALSSEAKFDTTAAPLAPEDVTVHLDSSASVGSIVRVYRSTAPFIVGDSVQYADYSGLCPCVKGDLFLTVSGIVPNGDFSNRGNAMPVQLQSYTVD
jgi:hypothetical protein